jgi:hypothetical protein
MNPKEIGCGTGDNAIWLAQQGFDVVAVDFSLEDVENQKGTFGTSLCSFILGFVEGDRGLCRVVLALLSRCGSSCGRACQYPMALPRLHSFA